MHLIALIVFFGLALGAQAVAEQKSSKAAAKPKTCTYDECVSVNKARGWDSSAVSRWCTANPGKCDN
jgi:hypothetical protein